GPHRGVCRAVLVGCRRRQTQVSEIRSERETAVLVGNLRDVPGRILGRAPVLGGLGGKSLRRRDVRWTYAEVPSGAGGGSREVDHAGAADGKRGELSFSRIARIMRIESGKEHKRHKKHKKSQ